MAVKNRQRVINTEVVYIATTTEAFKKMLKELTIRLWYGSHWKRRIHPSWTRRNMAG